MTASHSSLKYLLLSQFTILVILITSSSASSSVLPISSKTVASEQISFWSKNVHSIMPNEMISKLSPLSVQESEYFTSLVSEQSTFTTPEADFCSRAHLACAASVVDAASPSSRSYINGYLGTDPSFFFRLSTILQEGKTVHLPVLSDPCPPRSLLPSKIASRISLRSAGELKQLFPESFESPEMKQAMEATISLCNSPGIRGEIQACARSLEEMIEFAKKALGHEKLVALSTKSAQGSGKEVIIGSRKQIRFEKIVSCHDTFLPFVAFYCHTPYAAAAAGEVYRLFAVDLLDPETKAKVNTVLAACHMDTSAWPANHVAFEALRLSPGKGEVCHWSSLMDHAFIGA